MRLANWFKHRRDASRNRGRVVKQQIEQARQGTAQARSALKQLQEESDDPLAELIEGMRRRRLDEP